MKKVRAEKGIGGAKPAEAADPILSPHLEWVWDAFCVLSRIRLVNEAGPQPILPSEIVAFCDMEEIRDEEDKSDLMFFVNDLDMIYLKDIHRRIEKEREKARKKGTTPRPRR